MDMNNLRPEFHVAQQSRREKLRNYHHHLGVHNINDTNQIPPPPDSLSYDDPSEFCPNINYFSGKHDNFSATNDFNHPSDAVIINCDTQSSHFRTSAADNCWVSANQTPNFVGNVTSCSPPSFNPATSDAVRPYNPRYQELHSSLPFYDNALQELVSTPRARSFSPMGSLRQKSSEETSHGPWVVNNGDQSGLKGPDDFISRPTGVHQWNGTEFDHFTAAKNRYSHTQALSLSLSSAPSPKIQASQRAERRVAVDMTARSNVQEFKIPNLPRQETMGTPALSTGRNPGPLGPFTGYATILRSSKFLRPTQVLLGELCSVDGPKNDDVSGGIDKTLEEVRVSDERGMRVIAGDLGGLMDSYRPEKFQEKAKLLYMQDEVSKRYKQYHQQMQMVVSSFESVAGLTDVTPYVSLALKMVSRHFRCLKNAITDQLKSVRGGSGEELSAPSARTCNTTSGSMLKFFDQSLQRPKLGSINPLEGGQQHIWRPQRGLPERAVSVLRAWLFDHFLHPYPTDTDKHMLAIQTGLTRNQVSNWFINARVRVWKPMVEEIHMLETKGASSDTRSDGKTTTNNAGQCSDTSKMPDVKYSSRMDPPEHPPDRSTNSSARWINQEKRSRVEYQHVPTSIIEGPLMGFVPSHQTVSLTLGLRQSAENGQRPRYGDRIIRDFVG